jgi:F-box-like
MTGHATIDVLPDDVLLEIFDCYLYEARKSSVIEKWDTLAHVSRKWRCVVFDSPRRLNLQLFCSRRTPVREMLTIWPPLPIFIYEEDHSSYDEDNIIAALEQRDRVCRIDLYEVPNSLLENLFAAMQEPFPALESLVLMTEDDTAPVIPDTFLGGFAPDLETLELREISIPFPVLRKLLLSTTDLVSLSLHKIIHSEYFSPKAMVTFLSVLTRLEYLDFGFDFPLSRPYRENRLPPPPTRTLLPALRWLELTGVSEYLEDLVAQIDAPLLFELELRFFHQLIFDTPQLAQFISRRQKDVSEAPNKVHITFFGHNVTVSLPELFAYGLELVILCRQSDWQLSALAQVCNSSFPHSFVATVEDLYIFDKTYPLRWQDDIEDSQWLELLHPFTGVKNLFLSRQIAPRIAPALQELVGERANEVLPALQNISWEGLQPSGVVPEVIGQFVTARHLSGHPLAVISWTR